MATEKKKNSEQPQNIHADHRKRLRESYLNSSIFALPPHNVLEILLFYSVPRKNTNEIAHRLINTFGSFAAVFEAPYESLLTVKGVGPESALLIKFFADVFAYYLKEKNPMTDLPLSYENVKDYLRPYFIACRFEKFVVTYTDGEGCAIRTTEISQGFHDMVNADLAEIVKTAILYNAKGIIIAHNHPDGFVLPSSQDIETTIALSSLCASLGIVFCDHLIFGKDDIFHLSRSRALKPGTCAF